MPVSTKIADRLIAGIKRFQPVVASAKSRDVNESDTVTIIKDILSEVFGYDKYAEITSEYQIRGTYCDLALKLDGELRLLIEAKAIGLELKESYVKQTVDYAANQGVEWVVLTNADLWRVYKTQRQALSRFFIGGMILSEPLLDVLRRELRRISPGVRIEIEEITSVLTQDVLKRDVLEGDKADEAKKKIQAIYRKIAKDREKATKAASAGSISSNGDPTSELEPNVPMRVDV